MLNYNKRAQIGETFTWVVATILILIILFFFILGSSLLGKTKDIKIFREKWTSGSSDIQIKDYFLGKTVYAYFQFSNTKEKADFRKVFNQLYNSTEEETSFADRVDEVKFRGNFK